MGVWLSDKVTCSASGPSTTAGVIVREENERNLLTAWIKLEVDSLPIKPLCRHPSLVEP